MKILALDQSSRVTGWSIFDDKTLLEYGKFSLEKDDLGDRLVELRGILIDLIESNSIEKLVMEDVQYQNNVSNNVQTFKTLAEVLGVCYELGVERDLDPQIVLAGTWKKYLGIKGRNRAEQKRNAQQYVKEMFDIKPTQDECDAICIGLYGAGVQPLFKPSTTSYSAF